MDIFQGMKNIDTYAKKEELPPTIFPKEEICSIKVDVLLRIALLTQHISLFTV